MCEKKTSPQQKQHLGGGFSQPWILDICASQIGSFCQQKEGTGNHTKICAALRPLAISQGSMWVCFTIPIECPRKAKPTSFFQVTFWFPKLRSLNRWKGQNHQKGHSEEPGRKLLVCGTNSFYQFFKYRLAEFQKDGKVGFINNNVCIPRHPNTFWEILTRYLDV